MLLVFILRSLLISTYRYNKRTHDTPYSKDVCKLLLSKSLSVLCIPVLRPASAI
jgi:hypothetical protein